MSLFANRVIVSLFALVLLSVSGYGQTSRSDLEKKKKRLQKEIEQTNQLINETRKNKTATLEQLQVLNRKLTERKKLIRVIQDEMHLINSSISNTSGRISELEGDLGRLKSSYGKLIRQAFLNRNKESVLMMLYSAQDVQQAYKRLFYLRKYNSYRREQADMIRAASEELSAKRKQLRTDLSMKRDLLGSEEKEQRVLSVEKKEQEATVSTLSKKEKKLKKDLEKKRADSKKLSKEIQKVIEREIAKERERALKESRAKAEAERKKAVAEGRPVPVAETEMKVSPETRALSGKFEANKGRLPWPVERGVITESFGVHPHPVLKGISTNNNGIDIATPSGASVKAIYEGVVTGVISIPGSNLAVILKHGEYLTVYSNLATVSVSKGDKVSTGQVIGKADDSSDDGKGEAHLEIWKGKIKLDPATWIAR